MTDKQGTVAKNQWTKCVLEIGLIGKQNHEGMGCSTHCSILGLTPTHHLRGVALSSPLPHVLFLPQLIFFFPVPLFPFCLVRVWLSQPPRL